MKMLQRLLLVVVVIATAVPEKGGVLMAAEYDEDGELTAEKRHDDNDYDDDDDDDDEDDETRNRIKLNVEVDKVKRVCTPTWRKWKYTMVENGALVRTAHSVEQCQKACVRNDSCTGIYHLYHMLVYMQRCWIAGPWSGEVQNGTARSYTYYALSRNCRTSAVTEQEKVVEERSGVSATTIIITVVVVVLLVAGGVTGYAYQKKILCFAPSTDGEEDEEEATGESRLLKNANYSSKMSPSSATAASRSTHYNSRPSGTVTSAEADR